MHVTHKSYSDQTHHNCKQHKTDSAVKADLMLTIKKQLILLTTKRLWFMTATTDSPAHT